MPVLASFFVLDCANTGPAIPVESAETEKSAETSEDSTDTKQEDADMPKETEAEVVIVEGAAE